MNILITGSTKGIGFPISKNFLNDKSNRIICSGRDKTYVSKLLKNDKSKIFLYQGDLRNEDEINNFCSFVKNKFKKIDVLIHALGGGLGFKNPYYREKNLKIYFKSILV